MVNSLAAGKRKVTFRDDAVASVLHNVIGRLLGFPLEFVLWSRLEV
jgi:hypothetical protein